MQLGQQFLGQHDADRIADLGKFEREHADFRVLL
jgi:hypothetical protein